ncbi:MAG: DNA-3-methyladenine glycosylase I [Flavobacteriaceae bacterium]|nr:DNA-3-methyladenine glycosylase I [Flavobacteriaceae bacterium]
MENQLKRCHWVTNDELYMRYHDLEWGKPVYDDATQFEFLILETFQAGLSWITILRKRENFRKAFDNFDYKKIALYQEEKIQSLLHDPGIIRNSMKIRAAVNNAQRFIEIQQEFGSFCNYIWGFTNNKVVFGNYKQPSQIPANTPLSDLISQDLKNRGFKFVGSTVIYAHLQATGIVNDHLESCFKNPLNFRK